MTLDRDIILGLLPCFVCGDLPPAVSEAIAAAVAADPALQAAVAGLRASREACREALLGALPGLDLAVAPAPLRGVGGPADGGMLDGVAADGALPGEAGAARAEAAPGAAALWGGLVAGLGAAAAVLIGVVGVGAAPGPAALALDRAERLAAAPPLAPGADPAAALLAAGATPQLAMAPDLSAHGLRLVAVAPLPGPRPGTAAIYEKDGQRFVCQMIVAAGPPGPPDALREVGRLQLRAYRVGEGSSPKGAVVIYDISGMRCLFSGPLPLEALLELVAQIVRPA